MTEATKAATKSPEAFRTISEASTELGVPQHVLRFWETKFSFIRPMKRAGGRRFYRRQDIAVLKGVRALLHEAGYTIKGVQRLHKEHGTRLLIGAGEGDIPPPAAFLQEPEAAGQDAVQAPPPRTAEKPVAVREASAERPRRAPSPTADPAILKGDARARLDAVLRDIEQAKTAIDELLAQGED